MRLISANRILIWNTITDSNVRISFVPSEKRHLKQDKEQSSLNIVKKIE